MKFNVFFLLPIIVMLTTIMGCNNDKKKLLVISSRDVDIGNINYSKPYPFNITLSNTSNEEITILGISESCSCIYDSIQLPFVLMPMEKREIRFIIEKMDSLDKGNFAQKIVFHSDADSIFQSIRVLGCLPK